MRLYHINWDVAGSSHFDNISIKQDAEFAVHDGKIATPIAKFIMLAYHGKIPSSYINDANNFLDVLEDDLFPKWDSYLQAIDSSKSVYIFPDDGSSTYPNNSLPHNQYLALVDAYAHLSRALGGNYTQLADKLIKTYADELSLVSSNAYEWNYGDNLLPNDSSYTFIEDTSHGNIDIAAAISCYHAGIGMNISDMERFANTFIEKMWNQNFTNSVIGKYINTSLDSIYQYETYGWIKLSEFDSQVYDIVKTMHESIWNDSASMTWRRMLVISEIIKGVKVFNETFETPDSQDSTLRVGQVPIYFFYRLSRLK